MQSIKLDEICREMLWGILGGRAERIAIIAFFIIKTVIKPKGKPVNHDLQKALRCSFLSALQTVTRDCLKQLPPPQMYRATKIYQSPQHQKDVEWLDRKFKQLARDLKQVKKAASVEPLLPVLDDIGPLVNQVGQMAQERIHSVKEKLVVEALKDNDVPDCYRAKVKAVIFEEVCDHFTSEIKHNPVVYPIFATQLLDQINANVTELKELPRQDLEQSLQQSIAQAMVPMLAELKQLQNTVQQLTTGNKGNLPPSKPESQKPSEGRVEITLKISIDKLDTQKLEALAKYLRQVSGDNI